MQQFPTYNPLYITNHISARRLENVESTVLSDILRNSGNSGSSSTQPSDMLLPSYDYVLYYWFTPKSIACSTSTPHSRFNIDPLSITCRYHVVGTPASALCTLCAAHPYFYRGLLRVMFSENRNSVKKKNIYHARSKPGCRGGGHDDSMRMQACSMSRSRDPLYK